MKLIFVTRRVDKEDSRAGFVHDWLNEFARHIEKLYVICLEKGDISGLADNIAVESMGKERGKGKFLILLNFLKLGRKLTPKADAVFVHMHPIYVIVEALWARIFRKPMIFWYTHKQVDFKLRLATWLADRVVSASPESFRLKTDKVRFLGHGIDVSKFSASSVHGSASSALKILTIGRISPVKRLDLLIDALAILKKEHPEIDFEATIAGGPGLPEHDELLDGLKKQAADAGLADKVHFIGPVPYEKTPKLYTSHDIFVNFSETGSLDKAVLEAAASGCLVLTSNEAFKSVLPAYALVEADKQVIATRIWELANLSEEKKEQYSLALSDIVVKGHSLNNLVKKLLDEFQKLHAAA